MSDLTSRTSRRVRGMTVNRFKYSISRQYSAALFEKLPISVFFFQAEDGIRDLTVTGVQTCALPILIVGSAPVEQAGAASAISETSSELGGALGIAILGSIGIAMYRAVMTDGVPTGVPAEAGAVARATLGGAVAGAAALPEGLGGPLLSTAPPAVTQAFALIAAIHPAPSF